MVIREQVLTVEEFWEQFAPLEGRYELVKGVPVEMPPVSSEHGDVAALVVEFLAPYVRQRDLGRVKVETGYQLDEDTMRAPDVSFVSKARQQQIDSPEKLVPFPPDLAVEIVSPSEAAVLVHGKVRDYLRAGVRLVWVVYPDEREIVAHYPGGTAQTLTADDTLSGGEVIPGFTVPVRELFGE